MSELGHCGQNAVTASCADARPGRRELSRRLVYQAALGPGGRGLGHRHGQQGNRNGGIGLGPSEGQLTATLLACKAATLSFVQPRSGKRPSGPSEVSSHSPPARLVSSFFSVKVPESRGDTSGST